MTSDEERLELHHSPEWQNIAAHLPSPDTATAAQLELAADVLRARRFPEDALDYYGYALARGGKMSVLLNKMGVVRLELQQFDLARTLFERVVREDKHNATAWNNLGATEFMRKRYASAVTDYRKAASLDKKEAVFHANLALTYFEMGDMEDMRDEFAHAIALDPHVLSQPDEGGQSVHLLASGNYPRLCYEMAKLFARRGDAPDVRLWLAKASEAGFDVSGEMKNDAAMRGYLKDPEVLVIVQNAELLRKRNVAAVKHAPGLGDSDSAPTKFE